ncbi:MAG: protein kinase, partial [Steroidobacteraceae bacterium]
MAFAAANNVRLFGRYTLLGKLGAGGQGEVWRARDHEQGSEIALKILSVEAARTPGAWAALQREFDIASRLDHPLILKVYRPERDGTVLALPMELAPGGDLRRLRTVSYLEIGPVLLEIAQALAYTHERGIVHRDLKPGNVLFDARGHVRLADFGVAGSVVGSAEDPADLALAGLSPFTASPEQLRGEPPAITDDIYGLGALAYELLSGYPPYYPRFELKCATEEPVPPLKPSHQAPDRLIALVTAMLSKRADQRPASMRAVTDALDATLNDTLAFDEPVEPEAAEAGPAEPAGPELAEQGPVKADMGEPAEPGPANPGPAGPTPVELGLAGRRRTAPMRPPRGTEILEPSPVVPMKAVRVEPPRDPDLRGVWADIKVERMPSPAPREPERRPRWPWVLIAGLAAAAAVSFFGLPRWAPSLPSLQRLVQPNVVESVKRIATASQRTLEPAAQRPAAQPSPTQGESPAPAVATEGAVET